ncbi:MAG: hypothetical protein M3386_06235 [Actinomycetota bacterium]|nr:hypothetical protein [Actinomycetota bacterium]
MSTALAAAVLVAALACPVHMWWRHRRGADPCCLPAGGTPELDDLRARQRALLSRLEELSAEAAPAGERAQVRG